MKNSMKKLVSLVLVLAISFAMAVPAFAAVKDSGRGPIVRAYMPVFDYYDPSSNRIIEKGYLASTLVVDNRGNPYSSATMQFKASSSGTVTGSFSSSFKAGAEMDAAFATVSAEVGYQLETSVSWTKGQEYGAEAEVPAGKRGQLKGYIQAVTTSGSKVYRVYNTTTENYTYKSVPVSNAKTPIDSDWYIEVIVS